MKGSAQCPKKAPAATEDCASSPPSPRASWSSHPGHHNACHRTRGRCLHHPHRCRAPRRARRRPPHPRPARLNAHPPAVAGGAAHAVAAAVVGAAALATAFSLPSLLLLSLPFCRFVCYDSGMLLHEILLLAWSGNWHLAARVCSSGCWSPVLASSSSRYFSSPCRCAAPAPPPHAARAPPVCRCHASLPPPCPARTHDRSARARALRFASASGSRRGGEKVRNSKVALRRSYRIAVVKRARS